MATAPDHIRELLKKESNTQTNNSNVPIVDEQNIKTDATEEQTSEVQTKPLQAAETQQNNSKTSSSIPPIAEVQQSKEDASWWTANSAMTISSAVLIFGAMILGLATYLIKEGKSSESILRIFGTILIIIAGVFLVVAGYSDRQIAPVMGLLGTIAGYLLGKETKD